MLDKLKFKIELYKYKNGYLPLDYFEEDFIDSDFWGDVLVRDFDFTNYDWGYYDNYA